MEKFIRTPFVCSDKPRTEFIFPQAAKADTASLALNKFSAMRLFISRTQSNTAAHAAEIFKSSSIAAVKFATKLAGPTCWSAWTRGSASLPAIHPQLAKAFVNPRQRGLRALQDLPS